VFEHVAHRPPARLRPYVTSVTGYRSDGGQPAVHRGLPSPTLTLVVTIDEPLELLAHPDPGQLPSRHTALVGGLHTRPALIADPGRQHGVQLALTPLGARALLGVPAGSLVSWDGDLDDVVGPAAASLVDGVRAGRTWRARFAAVDDVLGRWCQDTAPVPEVARAWHLLCAGGPAARVGAVAADVGWSPRHLQNRVRAETGLTPKEVAQVARLQVARRLVARDLAGRGAVCWAGVAAAAGYADQSHLSRQWRRFTGLAPGRWLAAEFAFVHDATTDEPSGCCHDD
jgi:AraC-like DNA-binding protein